MFGVGALIGCARATPYPFPSFPPGKGGVEATEINQGPA